MKTPAGWIGTRHSFLGLSGTRGCGLRSGSSATRLAVVKADEIRTGKTKGGKNFMELNIGAMGHVANLTWSRVTEHDATDSWFQVDLGDCSARYTHRIAEGGGWETTSFVWDVNKRTLAREVIVNGMHQLDE